MSDYPEPVSDLILTHGRGSRLISPQGCEIGPGVTAVTRDRPNVRINFRVHLRDPSIDFYHLSMIINPACRRSATYTTRQIRVSILYVSNYPAGSMFL